MEEEEVGEAVNRVIAVYGEWLRGLDNEHHDTVKECAEALICIGKHAFYFIVLSQVCKRKHAWYKLLKINFVLPWFKFKSNTVTLG